MVLGMEKKVQEISDTSRNLIRSKGEWVLLNIHQRMVKMTVGTNQYDQIIFYVSSGAMVVVFSKMHSLCLPPEFKLSH